MRRVPLMFLLLLASPAAAEGFTEALARAYTANPDLLAARTQLRAIDEEVPQARAGWRPLVSATSSFGRRASVLSPGFRTQASSAAAGLQLQQPLLDGGRTAADIERAENAVLASRADLLDTERSVLLSAATAYQDVLRDRALLALQREKEAVLRREWEETAIRFRAGQLTRLDVNQANSRYLRSRADTATQAGQLETSLAAYEAAVGVPPPERLAPAPPMRGLPDDPGSARELAEANGPTVIASALRERVARAQVGIARAALLPTVAVNLSGGRDYGQTLPHERAENYSATLGVRIPIYQGGAATARVRQAQEQSEQSRFQTLVSRRDAVENALRAHSAWRRSGQAARLSAEQVRIAGAAFNGVRQAVAAGARSTFELLGQLEELYDARALQISLAHDEAVATYQLLVVVGRFTAAELRLPVERYDPTAHYRAVRSRGALLPPRP